MNEPPRRTTFIDLSHELFDGMDPYPGLPVPRIVAHVDHDASRHLYEDGEFYLGKVDMPTNVGTYVDAPFHRYRDREDLSQLPLDRLVGLSGSVVDADPDADRALDPPFDRAPTEGSAILVRTGWDRRWGTDAYWEPGPYLSERFTRRVIDAGVAMVGVDFANVDDTTTRRRPVHTLLLGAGVPVVEHLTGLDRLPPRGFRFSAPVLRIRHGASFPVRAFAELDEPVTP